MIASALLSEEEFKRLEWGKVIQLKEWEVEKVEKILAEEIADGTLKGEKGWIEYAKRLAESDIERDPKFLWQTASVLLEKRFAKLKWPSQREAVKSAKSMK